MRHDPRRTQEYLQIALDPTTFKAFLRDLLCRETGKPYFKYLAIPRRYRWLGAWRRLPTYQAEKQLLPVGGRDLDQHIRQFFTIHERLQAVFHQMGMPVAAIHVLQQRCPALNAALEHVHMLECVMDDQGAYHLALTGGAAPPPEDTAQAGDSCGD